MISRLSRDTKTFPRSNGSKKSVLLTLNLTINTKAFGPLAHSLRLYYGTIRDEDEDENSGTLVAKKTTIYRNPIPTN